MTALTQNFASLPDGPYVPATGWKAVYLTAKIQGGALRPSENGGAYAVVVENPPTIGLLDVTVSLLHSSSVNFDSAGIVFQTDVGDGYYVRFSGGRATLVPLVENDTESNIGSIELVWASGDLFRSTMDIATGEINIYQLSQSDTEPVLTFNETFLDGMSNGVRGAWENNNAAGLKTISAETGSSGIVIDSLTSPIHVGATLSITTTGLEALTTATTIAGKEIYSANAVDGDGDIVAASFMQGSFYPAMAEDIPVVARDSTKASDAYASILTTMIGWQYVDVGVINYGQWSLGQAVTGDTVITQAHAIDDGTGVLNEDLTLTNWALGDYVAWLRDQDGIMHRLEFTVTQTGIVTGAGFVQFVEKIGFIQ